MLAEIRNGVVHILLEGKHLGHFTGNWPRRVVGKLEVATFEMPCHKDHLDVFFDFSAWRLGELNISRIALFVH
jgi:hypothetical protein